jgi:hypothetical protein
MRQSSKTQIVVGRVLSGIAIAFLTFDSVGKLLRVQPVIDGTVQLGYPTSIIIPLGIVLLSCVLIYAVPRTSVIGAMLLTGYLGGAVATHARVGNPLLSHTLFPIYVAVIIWAGLVLRDAQLRILLPVRRVS